MRARMRMYQETAATAPIQLVNKNRRRYGGYIVHLGVVCAVIGIVGSSFFQSSVQGNLAPGETLELGAYQLQFQDLSMVREGNAYVVGAEMLVLENGTPIGTLQPQKAYYPASDQMTTEVALRTTLRDDLYLILGGWSEDGSATFKVIVNPLIAWLWIGFLLFTAGTVITMLPDPREIKILEQVRAAKPLAGPLVANSIGGAQSAYEDVYSRREMVFGALRDLQFEYAAGKLASEDYWALKGMYELEAAHVLQEIDAMSVDGGKGSKAAGALEMRVCPQCRKAVRKQDKFCAACGAELGMREPPAPMGRRRKKVCQ